MSAPEKLLSRFLYKFREKISRVAHATALMTIAFANQASAFVEDNGGFIVLPPAYGYLTPHIVTGGGGTVYVNSTQSGSITIPTGATSATATISSVGTLAFITFQGFTKSGTGNGADISYVRVELTNATTVTAFRNTSSGTETVIAFWTVIDATSSLVSSVQKGTTTIGAGASSANTGISAVTLASAVLSWLGSINDATTNNIPTAWTGAVISSTTNVQAQRNTSGQSSVVGWNVINFNASAISSVQANLGRNITSGTTRNDTITSVTTANTMIFFQGLTSNDLDASLAIEQVDIRLAGATTVTLANNTAVSVSTQRIRYSVIAYASGVLKSMQRSTTTMTAATSNNATITSVTTTKAFANYLGFTTTATTNINDSSSAVALTSATNVQVSKGTSTSNSTVSWEVPEFN